MNQEGENREIDLRDALMEHLWSDLEREESETELTYNADDLHSMVTFAEEELGTNLRTTPKVLEIFESVIRLAQQRKIIRKAILGPRGGGKTKLAATLEVILWRWYGYDCQNVAGSLKQAQTCYGYVRSACEGSDNLRDFTRKLQMSETTNELGGKITVSAASETSVRGPHPKGPGGGGGLVLDEVALIKPQVHGASLGQLTSARPSALLQLSTMGEKNVGPWAELIDDKDHKGHDLHSFDIFDVAERCKYDCETTCPVKEHFAQDHVLQLAGGKEELVHKAYCGGKAHEVDGHISIDEIATLWQNVDRGTFERELMGINASVVGKVYSPLLLSQSSVDEIMIGASVDQHWARHKQLEKSIGLDWGWDGQTCACYVVRVKKVLIVYRWEFWTQTQFRKVREHIQSVAYDERIEEICPDGANPSDNDSLDEDCQNESEQLFQRTGDEFGVMVRPVDFGKWKSYGIGECRRRLEKELVLMPAVYGGRPVENYDQAMGYLRSYETDDKGKPIKKDDHGPDAWLMATLAFSQRFRAAPTVG